MLVFCYYLQVRETMCSDTSVLDSFAFSRRSRARRNDISVPHAPLSLSACLLQKVSSLASVLHEDGGGEGGGCAAEITVTMLTRSGEMETGRECR